MANAKQCDICGSFYAAHKLSKKLRHYDMIDTAFVVIYDPDPDAEYPGDIDFRLPDLMTEVCPRCVKTIKEFIENMKENTNE